MNYTFSVTNTGDVTLTGLTITDPMPDLSILSYAWPAAAGVLDPGQTATATASYVVTQADIDATEIVNVATVTGQTPTGGDVSDDDDHTVVSTAVPHLTLMKEATGPVTSAGDVVTYTFSLVNDGALTLNGVAITDALPGLSALTYSWPGAAGVLAPGETVTATATFATPQAYVDAGQITNTATGEGTTTRGTRVTGVDEVTVLIALSPAISLHKDADYADGTNGSAGDTIHYQFTASNTGNTTLTGLVIQDPLPGLTDVTYVWPGAPGVLLPGQSATATADYVVTQADVDGLVGVTNTATVTATDPNGDEVTDEDTVTVDTPIDAGIRIVKSATIVGTAFGGAVSAGDEVRYRFVTTNFGEVTLHDVQISDPLPGLTALVFTWPGAEGTLAAGESVVATASYVLTQADVNAGQVFNIASTRGLGPDEGEVTDADQATTVLLAAPQLEFGMTGSIAADGVWREGDVVTYVYTLVNRGNVTLASVSIDDPLVGLTPLGFVWPGAAGVLLPGETATATATFRLTAAEARARTLTNTATASSDRTQSLDDLVVLSGPGATQRVSGLAESGSGLSALPLAVGLFSAAAFARLWAALRRRKQRLSVNALVGRTSRKN